MRWVRCRAAALWGTGDAEPCKGALGYSLAASMKKYPWCFTLACSACQRLYLSYLPSLVQHQLSADRVGSLLRCCGVPLPVVRIRLIWGAKCTSAGGPALRGLGQAQWAVGQLVCLQEAATAGTVMTCISCSPPEVASVAFKIGPSCRGRVQSPGGLYLSRPMQSVR